MGVPIFPQANKADAIVAVRFNVVSFPIKKYSIVVVNAYGTSVRFIGDAKEHVDSEESAVDRLSPPDRGPRILPQNTQELDSLSPEILEGFPSKTTPMPSERQGSQSKQGGKQSRQMNPGEVGIGSF